MLNADSRTLKNPSAPQSGDGAPQLFDEVARLRLLPGEGGQREREEQKGDEGEEREVGDHRREVRSTVCEELGDDAMHAAGV